MKMKIQQFNENGEDEEIKKYVIKERKLNVKNTFLSSIKIFFL